MKVIQVYNLCVLLHPSALAFKRVIALQKAYFRNNKFHLKTQMENSVFGMRLSYAS